MEGLACREEVEGRDGAAGGQVQGVGGWVQDGSAAGHAQLAAADDGSAVGEELQVAADGLCRVQGEGQRETRGRSTSSR